MTPREDVDYSRDHEHWRRIDTAIAAVLVAVFVAIAVAGELLH